MLHSQSENQSILIHDIKKHLQSIEMLNEEKDHEKISLYIQQLLLSSELKERSRICDRELLNAILSRYQRICSERNITFHADIRQHFPKSRIMGILPQMGDQPLTIALELFSRKIAD